MKLHGTFADCCVRMIYVFFGVMMAGILGLCLFFSDCNYACRKIWLPSFFLLLCGTVGCALICRAVSRILKCASDESNFFRSYICISICFSVVQVIAVYNYFFITGWDVALVVQGSRAIAHDSLGMFDYAYYSVYPNNLEITLLFSLIIRLAHSIGLHEHEYFCLILFQCGICWLAGILLYQTLKAIRLSPTFVLAGCVLFLVLVGMSPWVVIPYSDATGLVFPILITYLYVDCPKRLNGWKWFLIAAISYFGCRIKPQICIITIAILIVSVLGTISRREISGRQVFLKAGYFLAGAGLAALIFTAGVKSIGLELDAERKFGISHYLMMGMNRETMGVYRSEDVKFSVGFETQAERTAGNLKVTAERIKDMGPAGFLKQIARKTLTNYNDGTFAWCVEGSFFTEILPEGDNFLSRFLRSIYYPPEQGGEYYRIWSNFEQAVWLNILLLSAFSVIAKKESTIAVIMLAIIGLTVFEAIFEARARYLYIYAPLYIVLAAKGLETIAFFIRKKVHSKIPARPGLERPGDRYPMAGADRQL